MSDEFKPKSFWERPEGTTGMIVIALAAGTLFFAGNAILNMFTTAVAIVGQAITLTVLGAILFGIIMILSNSKFQTLVSYGFKSIMRKITGAFVEIDPIGIMKSYIQDLTGKRETMADSIARLRGEIKKCEAQVNSNDSDYEREMMKAKVAKDQEKTSAFTVASRQAGRLEALNKKSLRPLLAQMQAHLRALMKYYEVTGTVIDDLSNEVKAQQMQREMIQSSYSAMSTAKKILNGGTDQRELFDQAMEYVVNDYGMKMGEIENFMENSKGFIEGIDLENGVYEAEALAKLTAWERDAESILLGNSKTAMLEQSTTGGAINFNIGAPAAEHEYADLFKKK